MPETPSIENDPVVTQSLSVPLLIATILLMFLASLGRLRRNLWTSSLERLSETLCPTLYQFLRNLSRNKRLWKRAFANRKSSSSWETHCAIAKSQLPLAMAKSTMRSGRLIAPTFSSHGHFALARSQSARSSTKLRLPPHQEKRILTTRKSRA